MFRLMALAILLALAACGTERTALDLQVENCARQGGVLVSTGIDGGHICERPPADVGQACSADGDCEGYCLAEERQCSAALTMTGCFSFLDDEGAPQSICID